MQFRLRTLLILMGIVPPLAAAAWAYAIPFIASDVFLVWMTVLAACIFAAVFGRVMLFGIEGLIAIATWVMRRAMRFKVSPRHDDSSEFSLSHMASEVRAQRRGSRHAPL